jgi:hypothetical protein
MRKISKIYLFYKTVYVSGIFCAHHQELCTVHSAIGTLHNLHETYQLPSVQYITPDDRYRRCPKHVEFYEKINFEYFVYLVGCFIRNLSRCTVT